MWICMENCFVSAVQHRNDPNGLAVRARSQEHLTWLFPTKAIAIWQALDDRGHGQLVRRYFEEAGNWTDISVLDRSSRRWRGDPLYAVVGRSNGPFLGS